MDTNAAHELANRLVQQHGLAGWTVVFDRAKRRAGVCQHGRQQIGLSALWPGYIQKPRCETRFCMRSRTRWSDHSTDTTPHGRRRRVRSDAGNSKLIWPRVCPVCFGPTRCWVWDAARCGWAFDPEFIYDWTYHGRMVPMHPNYVAELEALMSGNNGLRAEHLLWVGDRARVLEVPRQVDTRAGSAPSSSEGAAASMCRSTTGF